MAAQTVRGVHDFNRIVDADGCPKACNDARGTVLEFFRARRGRSPECGFHDLMVISGEEENE